MHISLTPKLEKMVRNKVDSGLYNNASEVIRAALRLMADADEEHKERLKAFRDAVQAGVEQADRGEFAEGFSIDKLQQGLDKK
ncbi:MAG: hypothetical protein CBB62_10830 [Micavibrio sp. TMED2]|nr:type II toxin-antitoxin system ParD family antitoxin [Alphaproteobacteria bacterium]MAS47847.1 type II toxin-antitoxin system ParD family antitoxin [Alphaproteobacteria bacterium]MAX97008.1 type II toxin-antitoxin system ParD family antitoxin [Alphaproteobacteria bacterium]OUT40285.1 MAG: hypothetical protein CBB62_10830 [Micavibrio sp. TMED2]